MLLRWSSVAWPLGALQPARRWRRSAGGAAAAPPALPTLRQGLGGRGLFLTLSLMLSRGVAVGTQLLGTAVARAWVRDRAQTPPTEDVPTPGGTGAAESAALTHMGEGLELRRGAMPGAQSLWRGAAA